MAHGITRSSATVMLTMVWVKFDNIWHVDGLMQERRKSNELRLSCTKPSIQLQRYVMRLAHWGWDKMAAFFQTTFSNAFSWMKMYELRLSFHWSLFLRAQLTIFQHWFRYWLFAYQATSHYLSQWRLYYWCIYVSLGLNELKSSTFYTCYITDKIYHPRRLIENQSLLVEVHLHNWSPCCHCDINAGNVRTYLIVGHFEWQHSINPLLPGRFWLNLAK